MNNYDNNTMDTEMFINNIKKDLKLPHFDELGQWP